VGRGGKGKPGETEGEGKRRGEGKDRRSVPANKTLHRFMSCVSHPVQSAVFCRYDRRSVC